MTERFGGRFDVFDGTQVDLDELDASTLGEGPLFAEFRYRVVGALLVPAGEVDFGSVRGKMQNGLEGSLKDEHTRRRSVVEQAHLIANPGAVFKTKFVGHFRGTNAEAHLSTYFPPVTTATLPLRSGVSVLGS